jgi:uncharacterized coiled-coil DUF342 family protein
MANPKLAQAQYMLNDYFYRVRKIQVLKEEIAELEAEVDDLKAEADALREVGVTMRTTGGYGGEHVMSSPDGDPLYKAHNKYTSHLEHILDAIKHKREKIIEYKLLIATLSDGLDDVRIAIAALTAIQQDIIQRRHEQHQTIVDIGTALNYDRTHISHLYQRALLRLVVN